MHNASLIITMARIGIRAMGKRCAIGNLQLQLGIAIICKERKMVAMQETIIKMNPRTIQHTDSIKCTICNDSGWVTYDVENPDYDFNVPLFFAKRCHKCFGLNLDLSGIPAEFHNAFLDKFNFNAYAKDISKIKEIAYSMLNNWDKWSKDGMGLHLCSKTAGSGKTFLACCIAKSIMVKYGIQMRFITVPDYIQMIGDGFRRERGDNDQTEVYRTCQLLVLDDIGAQSNASWYKQEIFRLINKRMTEGLVTIYTSNMTVNELNIDDRTKNRIFDTAIPLQMPEESIRMRKAQSKHKEFLKSVL